MNENPLISVVVPIYKVENYLERCLKSIIKQTYVNLDIILVDDGSPDRCPGICDNYAKRDSRIRVVHKKNGGLSSARNAGIEIMTGEYVTFVDSDDFLDEAAIESWVSLALAYEADLIIGRFISYHDGDVLQSNSHVKKAQEWTTQEAFEKLFLEEERLCTAWGKLYRAELFEEERYPENIKFAEDMYVIHKIFHAAEKIIYDDRVSYYYNQEGTSLVRSEFDLIKLQRAEAIEIWVQFIDENYGELHNAVLAYYASVIMNVCMVLYEIPKKEERRIFDYYKNFLSSHYCELIKSEYLGKKDKLKLRLLVNGKLTVLQKLICIRKCFMKNGTKD